MTQDERTARIAELEADNARLRRLLDEGDAPGELRHRLRGTLALMRNVIREAARTRDDVETYATHLEDRLDALTRVQAAVDLGGEVDLHALIADEFLAYATHEGERLRLDGPAVRLRARAAQALGLAVHELAVNAVEHGAVGASSGRTAVTWRLDRDEPDAALTLSWTETGMTGVTAPARTGYGTEVLTGVLRHELRAETGLAYEPDGLRCTIRFPLPPRIGRVGAGEA